MDAAAVHTFDTCCWRKCSAFLLLHLLAAGDPKTFVLCRRCTACRWCSCWWMLEPTWRPSLYGHCTATILCVIIVPPADDAGAGGCWSVPCRSVPPLLYHAQSTVVLPLCCTTVVLPADGTAAGGCWSVPCRSVPPLLYSVQAATIVLPLYCAMIVLRHDCTACRWCGCCSMYKLQLSYFKLCCASVVLCHICTACRWRSCWWLLEPTWRPSLYCDHTAATSVLFHIVLLMLYHLQMVRRLVGAYLEATLRGGSAPGSRPALLHRHRCPAIVVPPPLHCCCCALHILQLPYCPCCTADVVLLMSHRLQMKSCQI